MLSRFAVDIPPPEEGLRELTPPHASKIVVPGVLRTSCWQARVIGPPPWWCPRLNIYEPNHFLWFCGQFGSWSSCLRSAFGIDSQISPHSQRSELPHSHTSSMSWKYMIRGARIRSYTTQFRNIWVLLVVGLGQDTRWSLYQWRAYLLIVSIWKRCMNGAPLVTANKNSV